ncbi:MAG: hypothetical protein Kow0031_08140 [Anaerolineae bacterium]
MTRICFVSYEIHPTTRGGAGVLIYNAARVLLAQGHQISFLLYIPEEEFAIFRDVDRFSLPHPENCAAYHVPTLCADSPLTAADFATDFEWRAYCFDYAAQKIARLDQPDVLEFFDYCGVAYFALAAKITRGAYPAALLNTRLHNSLEVMDAREATKLHNKPRYIAYALEHAALRLSEATLFPSRAYLRDYQTHYEPWLGAQFHSKPPLVDYPRPSVITDAPNVVLFYGRLYGFKGVDLFVEAAVSLLAQQPGLKLQFVLVGHDSHEAPDNSPSYVDYLLKKIPPDLQQYFTFAGHLDWSELGQLLSRVQFAVIPSYFESFCYAAHELYAAGIPLIVNNIPAFEDYFKHEDNALVFNGTVSDLTRQMARMSADAALRRQLSCPYSLAENPLGDFYNAPPKTSWIAPASGRPDLPTCLVLIIDDRGPAELADTLRSLEQQPVMPNQIVLLKPARCLPDATHAAVWLMGETCHLATPAGELVNPDQVKTAATLLILKSGDTLLPDFVPLALQTLARQPQLSFISSWKHAGSRVDTFSIDLALELLPFRPDYYFNRTIMRTRPGQFLADLFDPQLAQLGEVGYLWHLEDTVGPGITIPAVMVKTLPGPSSPPQLNQVAHLVIKNGSIHRQRRLSRLMVTHADVAGQFEAAQQDLARVTAELNGMRATKGWQLLTRYWALRDRLKNMVRQKDA